VERIDFCEVLKDPRQYGGKEITVRATYFYWFEMSDLYCLSCQDKGKTWLSISSDLARDSESELRKAQSYRYRQVWNRWNVWTPERLPAWIDRDEGQKSGGSGKGATVAWAKETNRNEMGVRRQEP